MTSSSFRDSDVVSTSPRYELGKVAFSVKNHNVSGPHLFPGFTTHTKKFNPEFNPFATPRMVLQRATKSLCNRSQFQTFFLSRRFIKVRPSHQRPVSIEFFTICWIPESPKSEPNGNVRIWWKRAAVCRKNHRNLNKSFGKQTNKQTNWDEGDCGVFDNVVDMLNVPETAQRNSTTNVLHSLTIGAPYHGVCALSVLVSQQV